MNLMKLFNINYLLQNLKKSKVVLSIFIGLIPILNTIIMIMMLSTDKNYVPGFSEISIINLFGIYILPIIISICLFNYIYKKKSVDFINSMPISRKSIFITNTILGIIIFTLMLIINIILISIVSNIFSTGIPFMMLLDYFWFYLIVYIFTYSATNLAMTISGNAITQIVVTLLLLFLVPFLTAFTTDALSNESNNILIECTNNICTPEKYYCYDNIECNLNKDLNRYETTLRLIKKNNYTTPFGLLYGSITTNESLINTISIIKMIISSIFYIILGYILFIKRKMEVSETSFKNIHIHNLVKSLTLVPMISMSYLILKNEEPIFIIFIIVIILIYYFVYDLITKKNINHIKLSLLYFISTIIILTTIFIIIDKKEENNTILKYNDIKEIAININQYSRNDIKNKIYIDNKDLIKLITKEILNEKDYSNNNYLTIYLKTTNDKEYKTNLPLNDKTYNEVINILSEEKKYINFYKNINIDEVYAIKLGNKLYSSTESKEYLELINNSLKKLSLKEFIDLQKKYQHVSDDFYITLYTYKYHDKQELAINGYIDYNLLNTIINSNNSLLNENITSTNKDNYTLYYLNSYLKEEYEFDYYVIKSAKQEIYDFIIKNIDNKIDMKEEYISLEINVDNNNYLFTTNNVKELISILDKKYNEIKDTPDYNNYTNPYIKESREYYD